jgi:hypothetical protein
MLGSVVAMGRNVRMTADVQSSSSFLIPLAVLGSCASSRRGLEE